MIVDSGSLVAGFLNQLFRDLVPTVVGLLTRPGHIAAMHTIPEQLFMFS
jgi:hypothetical protein